VIHSDFATFYRSVVLPLRTKHPAQKRLDGQSSGGSRESAGQFHYLNKVWTVHMDTHLEPLQIAFDAFEQGSDPFRLQETARGLALALTPSFKAKQSTTYKHLYIYSW